MQGMLRDCRFEGSQGTVLSVGGNRFDLSTPEGRMAARAYAYTVGAEGDEQTKRAILRVVKRDDG